MFLELQFYFLLSTTYTMGGALAAALVGLYLPDFWLRIKRSKRANSLERGFPDTLDLLVVCVEAGMGLDGAINRVSKEIKLSNPALSDEFRLYTLEVKAGKSRQEALNNLGIRTDLEDVKNFVGLLVQTIRFGTSMADTLRIYSDTFRTKRRQRAEEKAAKLPVKMIFPCFLFIFPAMFVVILGPAVIQLFETLIK
jgi:tight adherence protein C